MHPALYHCATEALLYLANLCYICHLWPNWEMCLCLFNMGHIIYLGSGPLLHMAGYSSLQGHCTFSMLIISSNCIEVYKYFACFTLQKDIRQSNERVSLHVEEKR